MSYIQHVGGLKVATLEGAYAWLRLTDPCEPTRGVPLLRRPRKPLPTFEVDAEQIVDPVGGIHPSTAHPLAEAIRLAGTQGVVDPVFKIHGRLPGRGLQIGGGDAGQKSYRAEWGERPMRLAIVGATPDAAIHGFELHNTLNNGTVLGGVTDILVAKLRIMATGRVAISSPKGGLFGKLRVYGCRFVPDPDEPDGYGGFGYKWGIRCQGLGTYDIRSCVFEPVQEHAIYVDSPQGTNYFAKLTTMGSTRTSIQIVNRSFDVPRDTMYGDIEEFASGARKVQTPGFGTIIIEDCMLRASKDDGGGAITFAGFLGDAIVRKCRVYGPSDEKVHGALVAWTDASQHHGAYAYTGESGEVHSMRSLSIQGLSVDTPFTDRAHVAVSGVEHLSFEEFDIRGDREAIHLNTPSGNTLAKGSWHVIDGQVTQAAADQIYVPNGSTEFDVPLPVSQYEGFRTPRKVRIWRDDLTDQEIDNRWS